MVKDKKTITFLQLFYYICCKDCDVFSQSDVVRHPKKTRPLKKINYDNKRNSNFKF
jgi:hypothetical protein